MEKPTVLIIDDDIHVRKILTDVLRASGYETFAAKDGWEAVEIFTRNNVHVALIDLGLPDIPGLEVLKMLKDARPSAEAIILTGNASIDSAIEAINRGAYSYLRKPYEIEELLLHIRHAVGKIETEEKLNRYREHLEDLVRERTQDLERAKDAAEAGNRAKTEFIANMSHEFRTPLNVIIGFADVLRQELHGPLNEKQKRYLDDVIRSGRGLMELIGGILDYSEAEAGRMELEESTFGLDELVGSAVERVSEEAAQRGMRLESATGPAGDVNIEADRPKLDIVLNNLLSNAMKFTPDGGCVSIDARLMKDEGRTSGADAPSGATASAGNAGPTVLQISVSDTGIGIKPDDVPKLFREFKQLETPYTKKYRGIGLGLALAKKFVELHGGTIHVASEFGKGSTFTIRIPQRAAREK